MREQAPRVVKVFVLDVPEFAPVVLAAQRRSGCQVSAPLPGYHLIESAEPVEFRRKELGLRLAVWFGLFTGGLQGRIEQFDREIVRVLPEEPSG